VSRIDRERRQYRKDLRLELLVDRASFTGRELAHADDAHAERRELLEQSAQTAAPVLEQLRHALADQHELLGGCQAIRRAVRHARHRLTPQAAHAHLEVLVEVAAEDGQELHALQQPHARIGCLVQHPSVEREP
jgi:hypothetical protein